jgi:hypothetical protein
MSRAQRTGGEELGAVAEHLCVEVAHHVVMAVDVEVRLVLLDQLRKLQHHKVNAQEVCQMSGQAAGAANIHAHMKMLWRLFHVRSV